MAKYALYAWSGEYPEIHDHRELDEEVQHLLKREIYQGDKFAHWFCSCSEFEHALGTQIDGTLSNIANQLPLECKHIRQILNELNLENNDIEL